MLLPWNSIPGRYAALKKQTGQEPSVSDVLEAKHFNQLLVQWMLAYLQRKIGMDMGVEPGAEMKAAVLEAEARGIEVGLIDRDIRITLRRFWRALLIVEKIKLFYALAMGVAGSDDEKIDVEELKKAGRPYAWRWTSLGISLRTAPGHSLMNEMPTLPTGFCVSGITMSAFSRLSVPGM